MHDLGTDTAGNALEEYVCAHSTCCQCGRIGPAENLLMLTRLPTFMQALCKNDINSINTVLYLIHTFLRPLNDQHAQKLAAKPVIHIYDIYTYLLHVYCNLIDSLLVLFPVKGLLQ